MRFVQRTIYPDHEVLHRVHVCAETTNVMRTRRTTYRKQN